MRPVCSWFGGAGRVLGGGGGGLVYIIVLDMMDMVALG